ncbi:hypothetical protein KL939_004107 [Ogataea angusta]|nr:hypothetical protein KL939_004107 [Ogataea angusta]
MLGICYSAADSSFSRFCSSEARRSFRPGTCSIPLNICAAEHPRGVAVAAADDCADAVACQGLHQHAQLVVVVENCLLGQQKAQVEQPFRVPVHSHVVRQTVRTHRPRDPARAQLVLVLEQQHGFVFSRKSSSDSIRQSRPTPGTAATSGPESAGSTQPYQGLHVVVGHSIWPTSPCAVLPAAKAVHGAQGVQPYVAPLARWYYLAWEPSRSSYTWFVTLARAPLELLSEGKIVSWNLIQHQFPKSSIWSFILFFSSWNTADRPGLWSSRAPAASSPGRSRCRITTGSASHPKICPSD